MQLPTDTTWIRDAGREFVRAGAIATASFRGDPDLVIIGVKRGGTTSIFRDLERHPSMCPLVPSARRLPLRENMKGVHYFDSDLRHSIRWYRSHFASAPARHRVRRRTGAAFAAEASPYYFFHPLAAQRAARALPAATFLVVLRDPVERTVSHWAEQTRNGVETLSLREALDVEADRVGDDAVRLESGALLESHAHEQQTYASQSCYADSLERWIDRAGRDRLIVLFSEDYYARPASTLLAVTDALDVEPLPDDDTATHRNAAPRPSDVDADLDAELTERFGHDVERTVALLGLAPPWPRFRAAIESGLRRADA